MSPFDCFDDIRCINLDSAAERWRNMEERFQTLGIAQRVRRFPAVATPGNHRIGCLPCLTATSLQRPAGFWPAASVLVFEDDALFLDRTLEKRAGWGGPGTGGDPSWELCYLGGQKWDGELDREPDCRYLDQARGRRTPTPSPIANGFFAACCKTCLPMLPAWPNG